MMQQCCVSARLEIINAFLDTWDLPHSVTTMLFYLRNQASTQPLENLGDPDIEVA